MPAKPRGHHVDAVDTTAGIAIRPLTADQLYRSTDLSNLAFSTTAELKPIDGLVGQARAREAIRFGTKVGKAGFNLFVIGPHGARMQDAVRHLLADEASAKPTPSDWTYVNDLPAQIGLSRSNFPPVAPGNSRRQCTS